jgi:hypothetical protein
MSGFGPSCMDMSCPVVVLELLHSMLSGCLQDSWIVYPDHATASQIMLLYDAGLSISSKLRR